MCALLILIFNDLELLSLESPNIEKNDIALEVMTHDL